MPVEVKCENCGSRLQVDDEHAGKKTRCPKCNSVTTVPGSAEVATSPTNPMPQIQTPTPKPNPTSAQPDAMPSNPYSSPMRPAATPQQQANRGFPEIWPLQSAVMFIKVTSWTMFIVGGIYCLTIIGIIFAWLPIWMGVCLQRAANGIEHGCQTGDPRSVTLATTNLATFFKITGVLAMIWLAIIGLYIGALLLILIMGAFGAAGAQ